MVVTQHNTLCYLSQSVVVSLIYSDQDNFNFCELDVCKEYILKILHYFLYSIIYALVYIGSIQLSHATQQNFPIPEEYIVVYHSPDEANYLSVSQRRNYARDMTQRLALSLNIELLESFGDALDGVLIRGDQTEIDELRDNSNVRYIVPNVSFQLIPQSMMQTGGPETPISWGLDRIDQREATLNNSYHYDYNGTGITAYVLDSGININHQEFSSRASSGYNSINNQQAAIDCIGHGTHVAGTIGGTQYGVAKDVNIVAVGVLNCDGYGNVANVIKAIDWLINNAETPAIANFSFSINSHLALDEAVARLIKSGVHVISAAGNNNDSACDYSPGRLPGVINVAATTITDVKADFSNHGYCVDIFAPGSNIPSANNQDVTGTKNMSSTAVSAAHVAGIAALYLQENNDLNTSELHDLILNRASTFTQFTDITLYTTNRLAFSLDRAEEPCIINCLIPISAPTTLVKNTSLIISDTTGEQKYYQIEIPDGAMNLTFITEGGDGNLDLFVQYLSPPETTTSSTTSSSSSSTTSPIPINCASILTGNNEECSFELPETGTWYVLINAFRTYSDATLRVTYEMETPVVSQHTATKDVFVQGGRSSNRSFNRSFLLAKTSSPAETRHSYLAFSFDNDQLLNKNTLVLRLYVQSTNKVARLRIRETENNWTMGDISYNNQPEIYDDSIYIDVSKADAFEWIEVDISPFLKDGSFSGSIVISNETDGAYTSLRASESGRAPSLQLTSSYTRTSHTPPAAIRTLESTDSTFVQSGYLQDRVLNIRRMILNSGYNPQNSMHGLINYDLSGIDLESSPQIFVRLRFDRLPYNAEITIQEVSADWNEDSVTWNTQPETINNKTVSQSVRRNEYRWVDVDVTSLITENNLTGAFRLNVQAPGSARVFSSGSRFTPELVITAINKE